MRMETLVQRVELDLREEPGRLDLPDLRGLVALLGLWERLGRLGPTVCKDSRAL